MTAPLLVLGHAADRTGPPIYLLHLLRWLRASGSTVDIDVVLLAGGELLDELASLASVTVFEPLSPDIPDEDLQRMLDGVVDETSWWAARREGALEALMAPFGDASVVYVNSAPSAELARALPPGRRVQLSHVHELEIGLVRRLGAADREQLLAQATRVFSVAGAVTEHLVRHHHVDPGAIEHHHGMVDLEAVLATTAGLDRATARAERGIDPAHLVVGACGTIEFRKGTDLFLRLAADLTRHDASTEVTFVWLGGDADGIARARDLADRLGIGDRVRFVGRQPDPTAWFALLDVFVLPSREDPFPLVCLEAAAVGTPIVAYDTGGIPDLLRQGCGAVVPYPDPAGLAAEVGELLADPDRRQQLGARGQAVIRNGYDVGVVAPATWAAIERWM